MKLPSTIDLILWGAVAVGAIALLLVVKHWHDDSVYKLPAAKAEVKQIKAEQSLEREQNALTEVSTSGFVKQVVAISDPERKLPGFVCKRPGVQTIPAKPDPSGDAAPGSDPRVPGSDLERDVSIGATVYGKRCEILRAEVTTWREWWRKQNELSRQTSGR